MPVVDGRRCDSVSTARRISAFGVGGWVVYEGNSFIHQILLLRYSTSTVLGEYGTVFPLL